jgi:Tfp pilus assembly protein PilN
MSSSSFETGMSASFLPEDYRQRKVEGRTGVLMVILFCVVMLGVVAAFFVTNREWSAVRSLQEQINVQYAAEAKKIEQLKVLEAQKSEMVEKAEITTALIEKVPRSILMAELINRMPPTLALTELDLVSKKIVDAPSKDKKKPAPRSITGKAPAPAKAAGKNAKPDPEAPPERPKPPRFEYVLTLSGLSKTDEDIADYTAALQQCGLLEKVEFKFAGDVIVENVGLRKFRIEANIRTTADARAIEPLHVQRIDGPGGTPLDQMGATLIRGAGLRPSNKPLPVSEPGRRADVPEKKE